MALRAGSYNAAKPQWCGIIREDGFPWYRCVHRDHESQAEATTCARNALRQLKANREVLPEGWRVYTRTDD